jgi:DNA-binding transcriptional ArsR family regulator
MVDLRTILDTHRSRLKKKSVGVTESEVSNAPTVSEIPDIFFDQVLIDYKLTRVEVMVLMYLYRRVWCRPNLYKEYGISQLLSHTEMAKNLKLPMESIYQALRKVEEYGFISTIRSGQYFVRKYFTKEYDESFGQNYDDFEV